MSSSRDPDSDERRRLQLEVDLLKKQNAQLIKLAANHDGISFMEGANGAVGLRGVSRDIVWMFPKQWERLQKVLPQLLKWCDAHQEQLKAAAKAHYDRKRALGGRKDVPSLFKR